MMNWEYVNPRHEALVKEDGEIIDEVFGSTNGVLWTVKSTGKNYYGERNAKAAAERRLKTEETK